MTEALSRPELQTDLLPWTLSAGIAGLYTGALEAEVASGAGCLLIDEAVTVVISAVADLRRCRTAEATGIIEPLIDFTIAVIVQAVADLLAGTHSSLTALSPVPLQAALLTQATLSDVADLQGGAAGASQFIDETVTVVV